MSLRELEQPLAEELQAAAESLSDALRVVERRRAERDKRIYRAFLDGYSIGEIAECIGLSKAAVALVLKVQKAVNG